MSFDLAGLRDAVAREGRAARVVLAAFEGSSPREVGAAMLVWAAGQSGTIGGGALEFAALARARAMLASGGTALQREALGPGLGQCCGGVVTLLTEVYDADSIATLGTSGVVARPVSGSATQMPLAVKRLLATARGAGLIQPALISGWMVEPVTAPTRQVWVWGAGHVGRAVVSVLSPFPELALTWVDVEAARFPGLIPAGVTQLMALNPADLAPYAPIHAEHLVLTYSHALDLELCHRLLHHGFTTLGLIGSATKATRFRGRLRALGHTDPSIARITSPIGDPSLGKHPQAIAVGVAVQILQHGQALTLSQERMA